MIRKYNIVMMALAVVLAAGVAHANVNLGQRIQHEITMLPYSSIWDWIEADVRPDGTVVLQGDVVRPTLKADSEARVKKVEGVTSVTNEIRVLPLSPADNQIRLGIYRSLFNRNSTLNLYALGANPSIHIIVDNGTVTLKGVVSTVMDKQLAGMAANGVFGVFKVENELQIETRS
jgi:hyperosmotically inducible protein